MQNTPSLGYIRGWKNARYEWLPAGGCFYAKDQNDYIFTKLSQEADKTQMWDEGQKWL